PLLPWHGQPLVAYQVQQLRAAGAVEVVVVVGHAAGDVRPVAQAAGGVVVENPEYRQGRAGSVRRGAMALPDDTGAIVTLNVDQPRPAWLIRRVLDAHLGGDAPITTPEYGGRRGHPAVFAGTLLPELRAVSDATEGLRAVVRRYADRRRFVPIDDPIVTLEFNTRAEYETALETAGAEQR
ncbi:MAG: nucleotidyltransferase family protein, partial [Dehalococcoidia bacterium]